MNLLESQVSFFNSITRTEVVRKPYSLRDCINDIKTGTYREQVERIRSGNTELKKQLPAIATHGVFRDFREKKDFILASGIIIIDLDNLTDDLEEVKEDIMSSFDYVFSVMVSPSGKGIKALCFVEPDFVTSDNYRDISKYLSRDFIGYGGDLDYLSITDCLIMTWDPKILVNYEVIPANVYLKEKPTHTVELEPLDENKTLWDDVEEFYMTVLSENIEQNSSNNFHYLQMAMLDLKKYGFEHPKEDLSFVIDYAEAVHKRSKDNKKRFLELVEICKKYPQTLWPYRTTRDYVEEDEEPDYDYSEFIKKPEQPSNTNSREETDDEDNEGLVDYDLFIERVIQVAMEGDRVGAEISLRSFADIFRFRGSGILTVTGIPGHGKAQPLDSLIYTPTGSIRMGDIKIGTEVLTKGGTTKVTGIFPQGKKEVYKVTFTDHSSTKCCKEHLWSVVDLGDNKKSSKGKFITIPLEEIIRNGLKIGKAPWESSRYKIPVLQSNFKSQEVKLDPYLLGLLIGDGVLSGGTPMFSNSDIDIIEHLQKEVEKVGCKIRSRWIDEDNCYEIIISKTKNSRTKSYIHQSIIDLGLDKNSINKFIPKEYLFNSVEVRMGILRGLMDTDGCVDNYTASYLSTSSKQLALDFQNLVRSLGGTSIIQENIATYTYKGVKKTSSNLTYRVSVRLPNSLGSPFLNCKFKRDRYENRINRDPWRFIRSIELVSNEETQCIMVENESHLYFTDDFIVTHNTEFIDQCILDLARLHNQETLIAGFEQTPEEHVLKLTRKMIGKDIGCKSYLSSKENIEEIKRVSKYIISKIKHINTISQGSDITNLLKVAAKQIQKSRENNNIGVKYVVIDPYNMLSIKGSRLQGFEKVEEILRKITIFSHQMEVMVILVAHPVKIKKDEKTKMYEVPDFYSVKGSSAFFEMSYHGLVVYREGYLSSDKVLVRVLKVKQANLGKTMEEVYLGYDKNSGRYIPLDEDGNEESGDHRTKDWLSLVKKEYLI